MKIETVELDEIDKNLCVFVRKDIGEKKSAKKICRCDGCNKDVMRIVLDGDCAFMIIDAKIEDITMLCKDCNSQKEEAK